MAALGFAVRSCHPHLTDPSYRKSEPDKNDFGAKLQTSVGDRGLGGYRIGWEAGEGPWSVWRGVKSWEEKEGWMSKPSPAQRPAWNPAEDGTQSTTSPARIQGTHMQARPALPSSSQAQSRDASSERPLTLPPLSRTSSMTDDVSDQSRQGRAFGVHSILNPLQAGAQEHRGLRRKADEIEHASSSAELASTRPETLASVASSQGGSGEVTPAGSQVGYSTVPGLPPRRMLSPRARVPRLASLATLGTPTATLSVQDNPFLGQASLASATDSATGHTPLPTPTVATRHGYGLSTAPTSPLPEGRRPSGTLPGLTYSSSASPSTQVSGFSQASQTSPVVPLGMPAEHGPPTFYASPANPSGVPSHDRERAQGIPVSSTGHSNYQLMTFNTASGAVQFPVDVQAASRAADDKRKRNAGASARFRARRKEKEREASGMISRLEQQLKDAKEDAEFYRRERDYLATALLQLQGGDQHFPRPSSPRQRRDPDDSESGAGSGSGSYASPFQSHIQPNIPMRDQGPRSATYSPVAAGPPTAAPRTAGYQSAYPPLQDPGRQLGPVPRGVPPGPQPLPPPQQKQPQQLSRGLPPSGPQRTSSYDPYRTEHYDRSWPPAPGSGGR